MGKRRLYLVAIVACLVALFFALGGQDYFTLETLQQQRQVLAEVLAEHPFNAALVYFSVYVFATALSLPVATVLTLAGGALFGLGMGVLLVSFASTLGASLAFLLSRWLFRDWLQQRYGDRLARINEGVRKDGPLFLFTLRLVPLFPFMLVNLLMGLTPLRLGQFFVVSQLGMLPATIVYVNAGTQLATIAAPGDLVSPGLLVSFALLGLFPWLARWAVDRLQQRRRMQGFTPPASFDANLIVIGAGSAGLVASLIATTVKAKVILVERERMGGDCLNTGCVPSKTLIRSSRIKHLVDSAPSFGIEARLLGVDFERVRARVRQVIQAIEPHDSVERYTALGVECVQGDARLVSPWEVKVGARLISARHIIIATGGRPAVPDIAGIDTVPYVTSDTIWDLEQLPRRLLVIGGGPIGCELAQAYSRLGAEVSLVSRATTLLPREDSDASTLVREQFAAEGIELYLDHRPRRFVASEGRYSLVACHGQQEVAIEFDCVLLAVGRRPAVAGLGLEELGIECNADGTLVVNDYLQTTLPTVYACGDVAGPYQFTHMASHQAWYAAVNALFGSVHRFKVDYSVVPWATFTDPEVARVGLNEIDARRQGIAYEATCYELAEHDRALADGAARGFVKVLTVPGRDRVLGATIVGEHAGDLATVFILAMRHKLGLKKILATIHIYPTWAEANKFAAGAWRRAHAPERLLAWVEKYHRRKRAG